MKQYIQKYIESKKLAWAPTTLRSEAHRLNGVAAYLNSEPNALWDALAVQKPYSRLTAWTRVVDYYEWLREEGLVNDNPYKAFKKKNARLFKHVYQPKTPNLSFAEAEKKLSLLDPVHGAKALQLLHGGLRYTESLTLKNGEVVGKGSKRRKVFVNAQPNYQYSYRSFLRALNGVGLTPHMLRKICATTLAQKGLKEADLCEVMGWSSFNTAKAYIAPLKQDALAAVFKSIHGGINGQARNKTF